MSPSWNPGLDLHTQLFAAQQPRAAVLLTHGYAEHLGRYERLIARLNGAGYSVYAYDQRGHGQSAGRRAVVDLRGLVQDHLRLRESLRGLDVPLFAFGHSAGGLVTAASALQDPRGLSGVILSSPALLVGENEGPLLKALSGIIAKIAPGLGVTELPSGGISRLSDEVTRYQQDPQVYHGKVPALTAASMLRLSQSLVPQLGQWRLPTLLLHGDQDQLAAVEGSRRFAAQAGAARETRPQVSYHEVAGGYHELFNDQVAQEVTDITLAWLAEQLNASR